MPNFSGKWNLQGQLAGIKAGTWTGIPLNLLYAWGQNVDGELGLNDTAKRSSPTQVGALTDWSQVSNGDEDQFAAIKTDGTLWGAGNNTPYGTIGDNTTISKSSPVQIGALTDWSQISVGDNEACVAIKTDGTLWAWGRNDEGQLGENSTTHRSSPVQIGSETDWAQVSIGGAVGAITTGGELYTWGNNAQGRLGQNIAETTDRSSPVQVGAETNWSQITVGANYMLAVKTDGTLWAWGDGNSGRTGLNSLIDRSSPVQIGALTNWSQVSAGVFNALAIKTDGTLWAWGNNQQGEVGDGTTVRRSSPVQIGSLTNWSSISSGDANSAAIKTDGTLWAWGDGGNGQTGQNNQIDLSSPVQVGSLSSWTNVSVGGRSMHGILGTST